MSDILRQVAAHQSASIWQRLRRATGGLNAAATLEARLDNVQRKILTARGNYISATETLKAEQSRCCLAYAQHESTQSAHRTQATANIALAQAARRFLEANPYTARWGAPHLLRIAVDIRKARAEWQASHDLEAPDDWSLVPIFDIWGKPYLPPP